MNGMSAAVAATLGVLVSSSAAFASSVNTISNVVFVVDESGSMGGEQAFLEDFVLDLDADLDAAGVTDRSYGVVGYGRSTAGGAPRTIPSPATLQNAADTKMSLGSLVTSGGFEDGYEAIDFALDEFSFTPGAAVNFVLVTDEDRDVRGGSNLDFNSIFGALSSQNILLNAVVNNSFSSDMGSAIGIDDSGEAYIADGSGGFVTATGGTAGSGAGTTKTDYVDLALDTGGAAWDLNLLRAGGASADSFAAAFLNIKVTEITTQPPTDNRVIPLPAAGWMLISGVAMLSGTRFLRRKT